MSEAANQDETISVTAKVMVVDDEPKIRSCLTKLLTNEGIDVADAAGGDDCLLLLRGGFRGVILLDVMMPEKDGWDTIREIRDADMLKENIICMLTAMDEPDRKMEGLQEVVIDYIRKPYDSDQLVATVRRYLEVLAAVR